MDYSIGEFSEITELGVHTLRYYEKEGLICPARDNGNRRRYSKEDLLWTEFIKRLKETNMPVKEIKKYAVQRAMGDKTLDSRMEMLIQHRENLNGQIALMQEHLSKLDEKIEYYKKKGAVTD